MRKFKKNQEVVKLWLRNNDPNKSNTLNIQFGKIEGFVRKKDHGKYVYHFQPTGEKYAMAIPEDELMAKVTILYKSNKSKADIDEILSES